MPVIWAILSQNKLATALGILLLIAGVTIGVQHFHVMYLDATVKTQATEITGLKDANAQLKGAIDQQNAAITKLKTDSDLRIAASKKAAASALASAAASSSRAAAILSMKVTGNECQQAHTILDSYFTGLQP